MMCGQCKSNKEVYNFFNFIILIFLYVKITALGLTENYIGSIVRFAFLLAYITENICVP